MVTHCQGSALEVAVGVVWGVCSVSWWGSLPTSLAVGSEHGSGCGMLLLGSSPWRQGILCCPDGASGSSLRPSCCRNPAEPTATWLPLVQGLWQSPAVPALEQVSGENDTDTPWERWPNPAPAHVRDLLRLGNEPGRCPGSRNRGRSSVRQNPWGRGTVLCPHQCCSCSGQLGTLRKCMG